LFQNGELEGLRILGLKSIYLITSNQINHILIPMRSPGLGFGLDKINITDFGLLASNYGKYSPAQIP
jgi:hypothetical protein